MAKKKASFKAAKVLNLLNTTNLKATEIAKQAGCTAAYVWQLKKQMAHKVEEAFLDGVEMAENMRDTLYDITLGKKGRERFVGMAERKVPGGPVTVVRAKDLQEGGDHYKRLGVEPWDVFDTWPIDQRIGAYRANCTKYIMRLDEKDTPLLNAKKLAHYAQKLVEVLGETNRG